MLRRKMIYITSRKMKTRMMGRYIPHKWRHYDEYKPNDAGNKKANDIGKYKTDIREEAVRIKSKQMMLSERRKPKKVMKMKADYHGLEAVHNRKCGR